MLLQSQTKTHFCNLAMVRPEYQRKGIATAMFKLAYDRVRWGELSEA